MKKISIIITLIISLTAFSGAVSALAAPSEISAVSAIVVDAETGTVLFAKNPREVRAPASLTKVMTAILTIEAGDLDRRFTVDNSAVHVEGTSMGLRENDIVTRRALCYGMLLPSGNDAANVAAVSVAGGIPEFVNLMNKKALQLGMFGTRFANPHGLDAEGHYTTAYDLAVLTAYALKNKTFAEICASQSASVEFGGPPYTRRLKNNNKMLYLYKGSIGVKTGFTDNARRCLISAAKRANAAGGFTTLIAVTLNAPDDWNDHAKMLDYGFVMRQLIIG